MRIFVSGDVCEQEVIAEPFSVDGSQEEFAVHHALGFDTHKGLFTATHVATGFAIGRGNTIDEAIESGRAAWASKTPEQIEAGLIRARAIRTARVAEQQVPQ